MFLIVSVCLVRHFFSVINVVGSSMEPTLEHGDRVLAIRRVFHFLPVPKEGSIVVLRPGAIPAIGDIPANEYLVKRLSKVSYDTGAEPEALGGLGTEPRANAKSVRKNVQLIVLGDNPSLSRDSRSWGPVPVYALWGTVLLKL